MTSKYVFQLALSFPYLFKMTGKHNNGNGNRMFEFVMEMMTQNF